MKTINFRFSLRSLPNVTTHCRFAVMALAATVLALGATQGTACASLQGDWHGHPGGAGHAISPITITIVPAPAPAPTPVPGVVSYLASAAGAWQDRPLDHFPGNRTARAP